MFPSVSFAIYNCQFINNQLFSMSTPTSAQHLNTFDISIQFKKKYNVPILFIYCRFSFKYEHLICFFFYEIEKILLSCILGTSIGVLYFNIKERFIIDNFYITVMNNLINTEQPTSLVYIYVIKKEG